MMVEPRFHINAAARALIAELGLREQRAQPSPVYADTSGHVVYATRIVAERPSDCPMHDREIILELVDKSGNVVPASVWSEEETRIHRQSLTDEEHQAYMPFTEWK
jgi:hypothetical protein